MYRPFFVIIVSFVILILSNFWEKTSSATPSIAKFKWDAYDPSLFEKIKSQQELENFIDSTYTGSRNTTGFLNHMATIISLRFCHGYSFYSDQDNWLAGLSGKYVWNDLSAIVLPDDILKHRRAACSQQTIVLMECCKHFGLDYRKVSFDHHFASEVRVGDHWNYVDVNLEVFGRGKSLEEMLNDGSFYPSYKGKLLPSDLKKILAHPQYGEVNANAAPRAALFQRVSFFLSQYFFCILSFVLAVFFYYYQIKKNPNPLL